MCSISPCRCFTALDFVISRMSEYLENVRVSRHNNTLIFMLVRDIFNVDLIICEYRKQKFIIVFV